MKTFAVIPTRYWPDTLFQLLRDLRDLDEHDEIWILDNSDHALHFNGGRHIAARSAYRKTQVFACPDMSIYEMWNFAWCKSLNFEAQVGEEEPINLATSNDDIVISPHPFLATMAYWLRNDPETGAVSPDYDRRVADGFYGAPAPLDVRGSFKDGGLCGWAFMFAAEWHLTRDLPFIDEQFEWWCGDDDLFRQIGQRGKLQKIPGLPVDHVGEHSAVQRPELQLAKGRDMQRLQDKYGR